MSAVLTVAPAAPAVPAQAMAYQKTSEGHFQCPYCGVVKERQNTMHYHMKRHEGRFPHECAICKKGFLQAGLLKLHMAARHADVADTAAVAAISHPFHCTAAGCDFSSLTKANCVIHFMRKHCMAAVEAHSKDSLTCPTCQKVSKSQTAHLYHLASEGCCTLEDKAAAELKTLLASKAQAPC